MSSPTLEIASIQGLVPTAKGASIDAGDTVTVTPRHENVLRVVVDITEEYSVLVDA